MTFQSGEQVLLKVSPIKEVMRFGKKGKLNPRYIGPFKIHDCVGLAAYRFSLPPSLSGVQPVFHVSMLKKYHRDGDYIIKWDSVLLDNDLQYKEEPVAIHDRDVQKLRTKEINFVKVQWKHRPVEKATWETEKDMRDKYPQLFNYSDQEQAERLWKGKAQVSWEYSGLVSRQAATDRPQLGDY
ncbi:uncharacterized protein LOC125847020 [Solanum stenotomum]|uniref:uncharacterized protein LOC125847020 n=1 Tax=Solanum stenotomum TaxID=172797 RepID=UPI0020D1C3DD|nr:uncharacterized protein LOC125847020 [Solanum stenotomum]